MLTHTAHPGSAAQGLDGARVANEALGEVLELGLADPLADQRLRGAAYARRGELHPLRRHRPAGPVAILSHRP